MAIVAGYALRKGPPLKIASVNVSVPPKPSQSEPPSKRTPHGVVGDAPWALSALPECFMQVSKTTGPASFVLAHLPKNLTMLQPGTRMVFADCHLYVDGDAIRVDRGTDHLRVPPVSRLYYRPGQLALVRGGIGGLQMRVYQTASK